jgi:hypothetical protein
MVVIEGVTPVDTDSAQEDESDYEEPAVEAYDGGMTDDEDVIPEPRQLPDDDIEPWLHASTDNYITQAETERFMRVLRLNPNFNRTDVNRVIRNFCRFHNFDAHLLPDNDIVSWYFASGYGVVPEPIMDRFVRELRHNFHPLDVSDILYNALYRQRGYSAALQQLINSIYQQIMQ